ncbi:MAG: hypothetical protein COX62_03245 [Deltaproteobacteria bacterium CG_4_10_14_0_2_um_filter_43_8]|nr:MAG: hypothetical protein COV43_01120 [Deltaproteobacteria bacterium CG11_big_fil_rev_8_21_14_0_20_42_23]PJA21129.1 MAG: hypothetical protein COX62_03245 [Deltaproteobacteria bacterium CG_4_10_14_0_2_um_filter_43_8]
MQRNLLGFFSFQKEKSFKQNFLITLTTIGISVILCTLGFEPNSVPPDGIATIWPGAITQVIAGILFGAWGVIATVSAGVIVDIINVNDLYIVFGFIIPAFIQSFIPAFYYRLLIKRYGWNDKIFRFTPFLIYGVIIPNVIGALIAAFLLSSHTNTSFYFAFARWTIANIPIALVLGWPLFKIFGKVMADEGCVVSGWWK